MLKGFFLGNYTDKEIMTGVTVVLCPKGATGGVSVRGGAPATHETDLLKSENTVDKVNAVVLSGGSAFGLESVSGVMHYLFENNCGFDAGGYKVPICVGSSIYDLECGAFGYPDKAAGYSAAKNAVPITELCGKIGAGTGATVAKLGGMAGAIPSGMAACMRKDGDLEVVVVTVVNALGNVYDHATGECVAFSEGEFGSPFTNTTISCVITNAKLTKAQANKIADTTQDAYAKCIRPVHTAFDGDTVFVLAGGEVEAPLIKVQMLADSVCCDAILKAVKL